MEDIFPLFDKLTNQKLSPQGMYLFWLSMGAYCEASRHMGNLVPHLAEAGYTEASNKISEIEKSEQHHGITLAIAATSCIKAAGGTELARTLELDRQKSTQIFASMERIDDPLAVRAIKFAQPCVDLFWARMQCNPDQVIYFLGVTYGVERLANKNIIPGEIEAFIRSGFYELRLEKSEMGYLREHAEECDGAEGWHEAYMKQIIDTIDDQSAQKGIADIERTTSEWYKSLFELITSV